MKAMMYAFEKVICDDISSEDKISILQDCIDFGTDINHNNSEILFDAIHKYDYDVIRFLIKNGVDVKVRDNNAIILACYSGNVFNNKISETKSKIIELLLEAGADPSAQNNEAIMNYSYEILNINTIKLLISCGADPFAHNNILLAESCKQNSLEIAEYLLSIGSGIPNEENCYYVFSVRCTKPIMKKLLLDNGCNPHIVNEEDVSLFEVSVMMLDVATCKLLLEYGVNPISRYEQLLSCIKKTYTSIKNQNFQKYVERYNEIIDLCIDNGLDPTLVTSYNET